MTAADVCCRCIPALQLFLCGCACSVAAHDVLDVCGDVTFLRQPPREAPQRPYCCRALSTACAATLLAAVHQQPLAAAVQLALAAQRNA